MVDLSKAIYLIPMPRWGISSPDEFLVKPQNIAGCRSYSCFALCEALSFLGSGQGSVYLSALAYIISKQISNKIAFQSMADHPRMFVFNYARLTFLCLWQ